MARSRDFLIRIDEFKNKVSAIKAFRAMSGEGLKAAKDILENIDALGEKRVRIELNPNLNDRELSNAIAELQASGVNMVDLTADERSVMADTLKESARTAIALEDYVLASKILDLLVDL